MKILLYALVGLVAFVLTLVGAMFFTGNLSQEGFDRLLGTEEPAPAVSEPEDDLDPLLKALKSREETVRDGEKDLEARQKNLEIRERDVETMLKDVTQVLEQLTDSLDETDADHEKLLVETAKSIEGMKAKNAAEVLGEIPIEDAAQLLLRIKDRDRGKILDEMDPEQTAQIIQILQRKPY